MNGGVLGLAMILVGIAILGLGAGSLVSGGDNGVIPLAAGGLLAAAGFGVRSRAGKGEAS